MKVWRSLRNTESTELHVDLVYHLMLTMMIKKLVRAEKIDTQRVECVEYLKGCFLQAFYH